MTPLQNRARDCFFVFCFCFIFRMAAAPCAFPQTPATRIPSPAELARLPQSPASTRGFQRYVVDGKLQLSLHDAILLALSHNTNILIDQTQVDFAQDSVSRALAPFDPNINSSFSDQRSTSPSYTQLAGAPTLSQLTQQAQVGISQTFETGTNLQASVGASKLSTNSTFDFFNPSDSGDFAITFSQPLLRGRGLLPNRGPILVAQRGLAQTRATFEQQVNDILLQVVSQYWNVVEARENLTVQQQSLAEAQQSYDHDKLALQKGALPPLNIFQSESQVAARRVGVIQAEYALKEQEDSFRQIIGADVDSRIRVLPLDLTEPPAPSGELVDVDLSSALQKALANRPEVEAIRQELAGDDINLRIAHNGLLPNLALTGTYQSSGLGGTEINTNVVPPVVISNGGLPDALGQVFGFGYPTYGVGLTFSFPLRNHAAEASMADAKVSERRDLYSQQQVRQTITLDVATSVHQLEQSKLTIEAAKIALDLAQKNLAAEQRKYELGVDPINFVLQAQTDLTQAQVNLVQAQVGYQLALTSVDHATGDLLATFQVQIANLVK